ncbi:hypothetical protein N7493_001167 [Penicillium malachiteum]|uniref:DUF7779 domain-containing protein n=1 Tax=Penicillium malachiteum TaxID=1324776 RepID=A0AAD6HU61_9EURO|nr:hypothetical protein N7493_001167 [Penicillium malachiteum]
MPLAISQAAGYIKHRAPRSSISQYLAKLKKSDRNAIRLLDTRNSSSSDDSEQERLVLATLAISFEQIRESNASAASLLSLMSFFDRQGVSERLLRGAPESITIHSSEYYEDSMSETDADQDFEDDITILRDYSLISVTENGMFFTLHRLVQLSVQRWLKAHGQIEAFKERFLERLFQEAPQLSGEYENRGRYQSLYPHIKSAISQRPESPNFKRKWAILLCRAASYAGEFGHDSLTDAKEMASKSRKELLSLFVPRSPSLIALELFEATEALSRICYLDRLFDTAIELQLYLMETRKKVLGEGHADTLEGMDQLAFYLMINQQIDEAEKLQTQVIKTRKITSGTNDAKRLSSSSRLAMILRSQKRLPEAEKLLVEILEHMRSHLGNTHAATVEAMQVLAKVFSAQRRLDKAEQLCTEVMKTRKRVLPENHPDTLLPMPRVAMIFVQQGRLDEAEELQNQVVETSKSVLSENHTITLWAMQRLADTFARQNRLDEAEQVYERVIETRKRILPANDVDITGAMRRLARIFFK